MIKVMLGISDVGKAVFATEEIQMGERIMDLNGKLIKSDQLPSPYDEVEDHYIQLDNGLYMGPSGDLDDFVNHSCEPNSGIIIEKNLSSISRVSLVAIKRISAQHEITFDYSTTMDEDEWEMTCLCNSKNCRRIIRDFKHLPKEIRQKYANLGIVPDFIREKYLNEPVNE